MAFGGAVKLTGESEYKNALKQITQELKTLSSEMKVVATSYDKNDKSVTTLKSKQDDLNKVLEKQKTTLAQATNAYNSFNQKVAAQAAEHQKLEKEYKDAVAELERIKQTSGEASAEYQEQAAIVADLAQKYKKSTDAQTQNEVSLGRLETQLNNAQTAVNGTERELDALEKELDQAENATNELGDAMDDAGKSADNAGKGFTVIKGVLANLIADGITTVITKLQDMAKQTIETGANFEKSMSNVQAISGATDEELKLLSDTAKQFGSTTQFSASEAADALGYMALAGWDANTSSKALGGVLDLAAASGMDLAEASDMVTDYLSAFGMEAEQSGYFADMLAYAQNNANTTAAALGEAFKNCAANMNAAGQDAETTTSLLAMLANQGLKGSEAGTALSAVMRDMTAKMKDGKIAIGDTQVAVMDANGNYRDMTDILADVEKATQGMGDAERASALQSTFTADSIKGLNMILNAGVGEAADFEKALRDSGGTAKETAAIMNDNLNGDLTALNSKLEGVQISLYEKFEPALRAGVDALSGLLDAVQFVVDHSTEFIAAVAAMGAGIAAYLAYTTAMTIMTQGWQALTIVTKTQAAAQAALNAVMALNPIGILIAAIVALVAAFVVLWNKSEAFRNFWLGLWDKIKNAVKPVIESITKWFSEAWETIKKAWNDAGVFFSDLWNNIKSVTSNIWKGIKTAISTVINNIKSVITTVFNAIKKVITTIWNGIKTATSTVWNVIKTVVNTYINGIKTIVTTVFNAVKKVVTTVWNGIKTVTSTVWNAIKNVVNTVISSIKSKVSSVFNGIKSTVSGVWNSIKSTTSRVWNSIKTAITSPIEAAKNTVSKAIKAIKGFFPLSVGKILSNIRLPKFTVSGGKAPWGLFGQGSLPKFGIKWNKKGAVVDEPTVMQGLGEDGAEAIVPLERNTKWIKRVASEFKPFLADAIEIPPINVNVPTQAETSNIDAVNALKEALAQMKIELDDEKMGKFIDKTVSDRIYSY